jgi:hypothetical protein
MRSTEIVLTVANLVAFFALVLPLPLGVRWLRRAAPDRPLGH